MNFLSSLRYHNVITTDTERVGSDKARIVKTIKHSHFYYKTPVPHGLGKHLDHHTHTYRQTHAYISINI